MEKVYGTTERRDALIVFGSKRAVLVYGFGEEDGRTYGYRHDFDHTPSRQEVREVISNHVNKLTDEKILSGFEWRGVRVWLSTENQFNFKAAYDLAVQTAGATLPVTFKLGEDEGGMPQYHTFDNMEEFTDFYTGAIGFVNATLNEGWAEKDSVDYDRLCPDEEVGQ